MPLSTFSYSIFCNGDAETFAAWLIDQKDSMSLNLPSVF